MRRNTQRHAACSTPRAGGDNGLQKQLAACRPDGQCPSRLQCNATPTRLQTAVQHAAQAPRSRQLRSQLARALLRLTAAEMAHCNVCCARDFNAALASECCCSVTGTPHGVCRQHLEEMARQTHWAGACVGLSLWHMRQGPARYHARPHSGGSCPISYDNVQRAAVRCGVVCSKGLF